MDIDLPALSAKDLADLDHLVGMVDIISYSFVESGAHMQALLDQLAERQASHLGVIAKIETARAFRNLPEIMLAAMGRLPFGIMIARGDLAMEVGPERLAEVQEEILWLAEAAHLPVVWATQVLETLAKQGTVSRPELTDAAMGERAECVMLNKGPFIDKALASLDDILTRMQAHQQKKSAQLRALHWR
jgi:pyruvate kinase